METLIWVLNFIAIINSIVAIILGIKTIMEIK